MAFTKIKKNLMEEGTLPQTFSSYDGEFEVRNEAFAVLCCAGSVLLSHQIGCFCRHEHSHPHLLPPVALEFVFRTTWTLTYLDRSSFSDLNDVMFWRDS